MRLFKGLLRTVSRCLPFGLIQTYRPHFGQKENDFLRYVLFCLIAEVSCFWVVTTFDRGSRWVLIAVVVCCVRLADLKLGFLRPLYEDKPYPPIEEFKRITLLLMNILEVQLLFASLYLFRGLDWEPRILTWQSAFYQSGITLATLGPGDATPLNSSLGDSARYLTLGELSYSVVFIAFGSVILFNSAVERIGKKTTSEPTKETGEEAIRRLPDELSRLTEELRRLLMALPSLQEALKSLAEEPQKPVGGPQKAGGGSNDANRGPKQ